MIAKSVTFPHTPDFSGESIAIGQNLGNVGIMIS